MIPRPELGALARRSARLAQPAMPPLGDLTAAGRPELWDALCLRRARSAEEFAALLSIPEEARRHHVRRQLLDALFGKFGAIASRTSGNAETLVRMVVEDLGGRGLRDALMTRARTIDIFRFSEPVLDVIAAFRGSITSAADISLTLRMRTVMGLGQSYRTLTGVSPGPTMVSTARNLHQLSLSMSTLRVVLGHAVPLVRTVYDATVAAALLENLDNWLGGLDELRRRYVREYRERVHMPHTGESSLPEMENDLYALALNSELTRVANARLQTEQTESATLPEVVYFDKALNEVAMELVQRALDAWAGNPAVLVEILRQATRIRSLRMLAVPLLDRLLFEQAYSEELQVAAIRFAEAFTGGFRRDEARLEAEFLYVSRGEGRYRSLEDDVRTIFESDEAVRERLQRIARDAARPAGVRAEAFGALLRLTTAPAEREILYTLAAEGDSALVRTFLDHVAADGTHSAFAFVRRLHERALELGLEPVLFEAAAATRHVESVQFLRVSGTASRPDIEELIRRTGANGIVDEMTAHRRIRHNIAQANEASESRERAIRQEGEHRLTAIREAGAATEAQLRADHANADKHFAIALSTVEQARHVITLEKYLRRLAELTARVPPVRAELTRLQQTLNRLADLHDTLVRNVDRAYAEVQSMEQQVEAHGATIREHHSRLQGLRGDLERVRSEEERIQRRLRQFAGERPSDPNEAAALRRRIRDAEAELNGCRSRIRNAAAEIDSREGAIRGLRAAIEELQDRAARAETAIVALNADIDRNRAQHREASARTDVQEAIFQQLLRDIDAVQRDITATERSLHDTHRALDSRVAELEALRIRHAELQRAHQVASAEAIRAADLERQRFIECSGVITELESSTAQLLATIAANQQQTADEVAGIDAAARVAEQQRRATQRVRQSMQLNVDLLMSIVKALVEPGPEARQVLAKMEGAR